MVFEQLQTLMPAETNMRIILKEVFDEFETDIIAHCLWEMSFYGYTQEAIKKTIDMSLLQKHPSALGIIAAFAFFALI